MKSVNTVRSGHHSNVISVSAEDNTFNQNNIKIDRVYQKLINFQKLTYFQQQDRGSCESSHRCNATEILYNFWLKNQKPNHIW